MNGGVLDDAQAMRLVNGLAGPIQPPQMQGLAIPKGIDLPAGAGGAPPPRPGAPGLGAQLPLGAAAGAGAAPPPFPPLAPEQATAFQTAFTQLDLDRDGFVQVRATLCCAALRCKRCHGASARWLHLELLVCSGK